MGKAELGDAIREGSVQVLETMFFAYTVERTVSNHKEPVACTLQCRGTDTGIVSIAVDREVLPILASRFTAKAAIAPQFRRSI
jgi:hypothetical protein